MELTQEAIFCDIKECLLSFNYPMAHCMSDNELGDVFNVANRCFLVSWMLKLFLKDAYENFVDVADGEKHVLGDLLYKLGFCTNKQRLPFMNGNLDLVAQIEILYKMFNAIKSIRTSIQEVESNPIDFEELRILSEKDVNLFPMYGDIRLSNSAENDSDEMESIHSSSNKDNGIKNEENDVDIDILMNKVEEELAKIELLSRNNQETINIRKQEQKSFEYRPNSSEILKSCVGHAKRINQFFEDLNTIETLNTNKREKECNSIEGFKDMLRAMYEEIIITLRYQKIK